jgi:hypothetical protein
MNEGPVDYISGATPRIPLYWGTKAIPSVFVTSKKENPVSTHISLPQLVSRHIVSSVVCPKIFPAPKLMLSLENVPFF